MAKTSNHIHKLKKHKYKTGNSIFFCVLPDCHFKIDVALSLGKRTICNTCGDEFMMGEYELKLNKPHCVNCGKVKTKDANGRTRYVKKVASRILADVTTETSQELRSRLNTATSVELEDDI